MYHIGLQALRAKIRGFHAAGSTVSRRISKSEKERRHRLWQLKRQLGDDCRHHLIAYGYLRGVPYDRIETCSERNLPDLRRLVALVNEHAISRQEASDDTLMGYLQGTVPTRACASTAALPACSTSVMAAPTMAQEKGVGVQ